MPLLREVAETLTNNDLVAGIVEEIIERDDMFAILPFVHTEGKAYVYNREKTLAEGVFLDPNEAIPESGSDFDEVTAKLKILAGDVDVDKFLMETMSDVNSQLGLQLAAKAKGMARQFHRTLAMGDSSKNRKEFDGLASLTPAAQTLVAGKDGAALTLSMLDELCDAIPNGADVLVMSRGAIRAYRTLLRATYGTDAVMQQLENFGRPMLTHNGIPILMNEFLPKNEVQGASSATGSIYAVRLNEVDGLHGIYGGSNAGFSVEDIGTVQNKDAQRFRMKWYVGTALKSTKSLARLKGVTTV
ncbi:MULTISPECIES: major capsid protein [Chromobacterium]|uniref:Major capsid protein n=1 Tax=Chromobacterium phragmitis TaxID=2202141 RepID=A0ABV0J0I7_9NEIS|nr:hypothetical protein [Chromobacterium sp. ASV23]